MVAWVFAPRTDAAAGGSEDVRLAESMAAHLARPRAAAQADSGVKPPAGGAEATVFRGRTELRREWKHNAVWDIESGLWASPFFGAFTAIRFFSLVLLAQLLLVFCCVFTEDGLAFPGWIVFSLAVATVSTGFPG
jgi:hypothetical protein